MFVVALLLIPSSLLMLAPVSLVAGIVTGIVLYLGTAGLLVLASPVIEVSDGRLRAGKASIPLDLTGQAEGFSGAKAFAQRGPKLDARAWMLIRGWISPVVRVPIIDDKDPVPYWLLSTRRPDELVEAINRSHRTSTAHE